MSEGGGHSVPVWFISWADMMTLLCGFFIMMYALSDIGPDSSRYAQMVLSVQKAFGIQPGMGLMTDWPPELSPLMRMQTESGFTAQRGDSEDPGQDGQYATVKTIRNGLEFRLGGAVAFKEGQAELQEAVHHDLLRLAQAIRGYTNKIEVRGHTSKVPVPPESPFKDHMDLSYARARAVADFLVQQGGIDPRRVRVAAAGATEPLENRAYDDVRRARNSRVEIVVTEALVQEFEGDQPASQPAGNPEAEGPSSQPATEGATHGR